MHTNQRIYFDSFSRGRYLVSGSTDGCVYGWDLEPAPQGAEEEGEVTGAVGCGLEPVLLHCGAHSDAINGTRYGDTL